MKQDFKPFVMKSSQNPAASPIIKVDRTKNLNEEMSFQFMKPNEVDYQYNPQKMPNHKESQQFSFIPPSMDSEKAIVSSTHSSSNLLHLVDNQADEQLANEVALNAVSDSTPSFHNQSGKEKSVASSSVSG
jgi:hypothetical protein